MWKYVLGQKQMLGYQFRRERPILNYIADFVCLEIMLIIEVDGITHDTDEAQRRDEIRDQKLKGIEQDKLLYKDLHSLTPFKGTLLTHPLRGSLL